VIALRGPTTETEPVPENPGRSRVVEIRPARVLIEAGGVRDPGVLSARGDEAPRSFRSLKREILVSASPQESWVALLEDGRLVELMYDRPDQGRLVGDIFLGRVEAVLPGIQAAFVDIGADKAGFLHATDLDYPEEDDEENGDNESRGGSRREIPIQDVIRQGEDVLVQVTKEPIGTKGPRLTTQISLPGRFLVFMPGSSHVGVSRKIEDRGERARLRKLARELVPTGSGGVIVRTVGEELNRNTFEREFQRLHEV
jgi:ribonuclease G